MLTPSDAHRIGLEAAALGAKATPGPWDVDYIRGAVRHIVRNVDTEAFGYEGDFRWHYRGPDDGPFIAHAGTHYASLGSWAARWAKVVEAAEAFSTAKTAHDRRPDAQSRSDLFHATDQMHAAVRAALKESPHAD